MSQSLPSGLACSGKSPKNLSRYLPVFWVAWLGVGACPAYGNAAGDEIGPVLQQSIIWIEEKPVLQQVYCVFRREFDLPQKPTQAQLHLFADSRYILWINGVYVDRGPCRFDSRYPEYDTLDIQKFLQPGPNAIAVLVHNYSGAVNGRMMNHLPGFTARLDIADSDGKITTITTDEAWRANDKTRFGLSPEIPDLLPGKHMWSSIADNIDARKDTGDWSSPGFDDSQWTQPYPIDGSLWGLLKPRSIPLLRELEVTPLEIIELTNKTQTAPHWIWYKEKDFPAQKEPRWAAPEGERFFRRTFELPQDITRLTVYATADNEFDCYFNGQKVGENHQSGFSSWTALQILDATSLCRPGNNTIAVSASNKHYGDISPPAGLLVIIEWQANGQSGYLLSDADWKSSDQLEPGWEAPSHDDSAWPAALALCPYSQGPWQSNINNFPSFSTTSSPSPRLPLTLRSGQTLVLDAGEFTQAYSVLDFEAEEGSLLELNYAQTYYSSGRQPVSAWNMPNRYIARAGRQEYRSGDTFGFKYLVIEVLSGSIQLHNVQIINRLYPFDLIGQFTCNDEMLNTLWQNSMRTVLLCSEDAYVDCATRERVEWLGDGVSDEYPITRVAFAGPGADGKPRYGDPRLIRNMLRHIGQSSQPDGRVRANYPNDYWDVHSYIEDYACLWMQGIRTYYDTTGDLELSRELWPAITKQLQWFLDQKTPNGLVNTREFVFHGNPLVYQVCEGVTLNAAIYKAFHDMAAMAKLLGRNDQHHQYAAEAAALSEAVNEHLWDEQSGSYYGAIQNGKKTPPTAHGAVMALYFGIVPEDRWERVNQWLLANYTREDFSPYVHRYLFEVLYQMNNPEVDQLVLDLIRQRWAGMVNYETKTVWEAFGPHEPCHNMGAPPAYFLSAYVLGVRVEQPVTQKRIVIEPRLGDLTFAKGIVVTEFGPVPISWQRSDPTGLAFHFEIPGGTTADVSIPRLAETPTLTLNEKVIVENGKLKDNTVKMDLKDIRFQLDSGIYTGELK